MTNFANLSFNRLYRIFLYYKHRWMFRLACADLSKFVKILRFHLRACRKLFLYIRPHKLRHILLSCCQKRQKIEMKLKIRGHLKILNGTKLTLIEHEWPRWPFGINLVPVRIFRHPLSPKSVSWLGHFCRFL